MVIVLMGVAGSGKTTIGEELAAGLHWDFADADQFHPPANVAKMGAGHALTDEDRRPWLASIRAYIDAHLKKHQDAIVTCSALKQRYRDVIIPNAALVKLVYLKGTREVLWARISGRKGHFMKPAMLDSQLATLEEPTDALVVDVDQTAEKIVAEIRSGLTV